MDTVKIVRITEAECQLTGISAPSSFSDSHTILCTTHSFEQSRGLFSSFLYLKNHSFMGDLGAGLQMLGQHTTFAIGIFTTSFSLYGTTQCDQRTPLNTRLIKVTWLVKARQPGHWIRLVTGGLEGAKLNVWPKIWLIRWVITGIFVAGKRIWGCEFFFDSDLHVWRSWVCVQTTAFRKINPAIVKLALSRWYSTMGVVIVRFGIAYKVNSLVSDWAWSLGPVVCLVHSINCQRIHETWSQQLPPHKLFGRLQWFKAICFVRITRLFCQFIGSLVWWLHSILVNVTATGSWW